MRGKSHFLISAFLTQSIGMLVFKDYSLAPMAIGGFCALFPDIDEDQSTISYTMIKHFGGTKRVAGENSLFTDKLHNQRVKLTRQIALSTVSIGIAIVLLYFKMHITLPLAAFYLAILPWMSHRSLSHSFVSVLIFGVLLIAGFSNMSMMQFGVYAVVGYFLHLFEDMFTVSGVPFFYPFTKKRFKVPLMKTNRVSGSIVEWCFILISLSSCIYFYLNQ